MLKKLLKKTLITNKQKDGLEWNHDILLVAKLNLGTVILKVYSHIANVGLQGEVARIVPAFLPRFLVIAGRGYWVSGPNLHYVAALHLLLLLHTGREK